MVRWKDQKIESKRMSPGPPLAVMFLFMMSILCLIATDPNVHKESKPKRKPFIQQVVSFVSPIIKIVEILK
jgi:hypothetical protein